MLVGVTRLRLRSVFTVPHMAWWSRALARQARQIEGFRGGRLLIDRHLTFWSMTVWDDEAAMLRFRDAGAHRRVMPLLARWCDEAATVHWPSEDTALPGWPEAYTRLITTGRPARVDHPSDAQATLAHPAPVVRAYFDNVI